MILTKKEVLKEIKNKHLIITPFKKSNIGSASIDLTLSNQFRIFTRHNKKITLEENSDYKKYTKLIKANKITVFPGDFILAITQETICLPDHLCGWLYGRTRYARFGLSIHSTASFIQPGVKNKQVLEIKNLGKVPIVLKKGLRICQLILEQTRGKATYNGKFKNQIKL